MKIFKNKLAVTVIVLSVTFLGLIIFSAKKNNYNIFSSSAGAAVNPVQKLAYKASEKVKGCMTFFYTFSDVKRENEDLKKKNIELENKLIEYDTFKKTNDELKSILDFKNESDKNDSKYKYIGTNIIGISGGGFQNGYIIDKGKKDGVGTEMVVISANGLVGQVSEVGSNWAKVQTLVNENVAVHAKVKESNESGGIVKGYKDSNGKLLAKIDFLPIESKIKVGDEIYTSGLGKVYPKNIKIGKVLSVDEDKVKVNKSAVIEPYVEFNKLEELVVIVYNEEGKY